jgi:hypothetical protein
MPHVSYSFWSILVLKTVVYPVLSNNKGSLFLAKEKKKKMLNFTSV